jgi:hypothetical protein
MIAFKKAILLADDYLEQKARGVDSLTHVDSSATL